jgi:hypothetical protein
MRPSFVTIAAVLVVMAPLRADGAPAISLSGYVRDSPIAWTAEDPVTGAGRGGPERFTNLLHTRQNLRLFAGPAATVGLEVRTRWFAGDAARELVDRTGLTAGRGTWFDAEHRFVDEPRAVVVSAIDRAWLGLERGPVQATLGRQRIAWGTALVWNPIDVLNPASPLDFDDVEKPGTDAARMQVWLGPASKLDVAAAPARHADEGTLVGELVVNHAGVDWVAMGGRRGPWALAGGAWAGNVGGGGFRGEFLVSFPRAGLRLPGTASAEQTNVLACLDGDDTFGGTLTLHAAVLYNLRGTAGDAGGTRLLEADARRWPTPARWSLYAEAGRDAGPLVHVDLAGILDPGDGSWYVGPTVTWSAAADLDVSASALAFGGRHATEFGDDGHLLMSRVQWSY